MKILMVNKFLRPGGGSEAYMLGLGAYLQSRGHTVEYFGMDNAARTVGNSAECYVEEQDFGSISIKNLLSPVKTIYSREARRKITVVLDRLQPDIVHLNNINFQLTPSIYYGIRSRRVPMVQTVHDPQLGCPCHRLFIDHTQQVCSACLGGSYRHCIANRCVARSSFKSFLAAAESWYYHRRNTYALVDKFICPSDFIAGILRQSGVVEAQLEILRNFAVFNTDRKADVQKKNYVLYFGRYSAEKGLRTLLEACRRLSDIPFVFAGTGPLESALNGIPNVTNIGFQTGDALRNVIAAAAFSIYPSIWYENCPMSVLESQMVGTPVIGSDIGGIPELIEPGVTGELVESGSAEDLADKISSLYRDVYLLKTMQANCLTHSAAVGIDRYYARLIGIYEGVIAKQVRNEYSFPSH